MEFANISEITDTYRATITEMRKYFDRGGDWFNVGIEGKENWSFQSVDKYSPVCGVVWSGVVWCSLVWEDRG